MEQTMFFPQYPNFKPIDYTRVNAHQQYLLDVFVILTQVMEGKQITAKQRKKLLERPEILRSAVRAAFYKSKGTGVERFL